tara:strand:+ start:189 stop:587 length:399 start_codon:yes stop_codon:yes gene_type:complete
MHINASEQKIRNIIRKILSEEKMIISVNNPDAPEDTVYVRDGNYKYARSEKDNKTWIIKSPKRKSRNIKPENFSSWYEVTSSQQEHLNSINSFIDDLTKKATSSTPPKQPAETDEEDPMLASFDLSDVATNF